MQLPQIIATLTASAVGTVHAMKAPGDYAVWIPQWDFEVTPGGDHVVLNGTVEQVMEQLQESNPKLMASFNLFDEHGGIIKTRDETDPLPLKDFRTICQEQESGQSDSFLEGIKYLRKVPGKPVNGPGPGECGRVSCSWNSHIWWCNDDTKTKTLSTFGHIADGAYAAYIDCTDNNEHVRWASGQAFHKRDDWNVILRGRKRDEEFC